ncbi:sialidase-3 [Strongylocentrotus purpuratus]|uniref:Sialidase domain-containing protein n=1 Tax=Strongylocentrotus purpuratus TaxID=7668 RepID=A0A7M7NZA6_STRPU|nr:sialidase-3 [Strongylocentrotus purpuratus]
MGCYEEIRRIVVWLLHPLIIRFRREEPPVRVEHHDYWCGDVPQEVFGQGDNGYNTFRIPALVHHRGVFLAFCEARRTSFRDWGASMDLVLRRGRLCDIKEGDKEIEWGDIQVVASLPGKRAMNPVPIVDADMDAIILVFITFPIELSEADLIRGDKYQQNLYVTKSVDEGRTWSEPLDITNLTLGRMDPEPLIYASGPGHGLQLKSGRLIVPGNIHWKEKPQPGATGWLAELKWSILEFFDSFHGSRNCSIVLFSDDGGDTWQVGGKIPPAKDEDGVDIPANECQAAELEEGHVYVNSRTCDPQATRQESYSIDGGISFTMGELSDDLEEPGYFLSRWIPSIKNFGGCQASVMSFEPPDHIPKLERDAERWIIFSNPASRNTRVNMSVRFSRDACQTWSPPLSLNPGPSAYSDLTCYRVKDKVTGKSTMKFACLYECGSLHPYERIAFQTFSLEELTSNARGNQP